MGWTGKPKGGTGIHNGSSTYFATCTDTRNTLAKTVTVSDSELTLTDGLQITIRFEHGLRSTTHAEGATTLNINGTGAKELWINGVDATDVDDSVANIYVDNSGAITVMYNEASDTYAIVGRESFNGSGTGELVDDAIEERHISNGAVKERHIADGAVGADQLKDISVGTKKVIDGAITEEKLDPTFKDTLATKADLAQKADESDLRTAESKITANTEKITTLVGDDTGKSVRKIANEELAARLIKNAGNEASLNTLQEIAEWIANHPDDAAAMNAAITALQDILSGLGTNKGDVKKYIDNAIAALNMGDYAKASELTAAAGQASDVAYKLNSFLNTGYEGTPEYVSIKEIADDIKSVRESVPSLDGYATEEYLAEELAKRGQLKPEFANSIEECTDTTKLYVLPDGYIYAYMTKSVIAEPPELYDPSATTLNVRHSGSPGSIVSGRGYLVTDYIPVDVVDRECVLQMVRNDVLGAIQDGVVVPHLQKIGFYDEKKTCIGSDYAASQSTQNRLKTEQVDDNTVKIYVGYLEDDSKVDYYDNIAYVRIEVVFYSSTAVTADDASSLTSIKDINGGGTATTTAWHNTGRAFVPADYEDRINAAEDAINEHSEDIDIIKQQINNLEIGTSSAVYPLVWDGAVTECISKIKALQNECGRNCVTFPFFSDNHQRNGYAGALIAKVMNECNIPYCFYGGDSISSGYIDSEETMIAQDKAFDTMMQAIPNGRFCRAVGNHDGYWAVSADEKHTYTREQVYNLFLREESIAQNKHFGDDGTYYYVEDIASKVRFVVMNTNGGSVDAVQLNWLKNTALKFTESGWVVVFISHQPITNNYHANISNAQAVQNILTEYINGTDVNKADVAGWFSGHIHRDRIYQCDHTGNTEADDTTTVSLPWKTVTITSDHTSIAYDDATKHTVANDDQSHAIDFVTINKSTRTVNITRLGIGEDRSYTY